MASSNAAIVSAGTLSLLASNAFSVASFGGGSPDLTVSSNIVGGFAIAKQGAGWHCDSLLEFSITAAQPHFAGTLQLGNATALGSTTGNLVASAGVLNLNGFNLGVNAFSGASGTIDNLAPATTATLTIGNANSGGTFSGTIQNSGSGSVVNLNKDGSGTTILNSANTYSGNTNINSGALFLNGSHTGGGTTP